MQDKISNRLHCVILAGGTGSRLWPLSRNAMPKQFLDLMGVGRSMLQLTYDRYAAICKPENFLVVTLDEYRHIVEEQLPNLGAENIICEPFKRNTLAAVALANAYIKQTDPEAIVVVSPADHLILNNDVFLDAVGPAAAYASAHDVLMTIGIRVTRPETAFGYIQVGSEVASGTTPVHSVRTFTEKPNEEMAQTFMDCGDFCWNSGVFVWRQNTIARAIRQFMPEFNRAFEVLDTLPASRWNDGALRMVYEQVESISIDYGVMEKARNVAVCLTNAVWSDVGAWEAVFEQVPKDENQNAMVCTNGANILQKDSHGCILCPQPGEQLVVEGLNNFMVVQRSGVTLICPRTSAKNVWRYAAELKAERN